MISKFKTCDSGESSGTREARYIPGVGVVRPMGSGLPLRAIDEKCTTHHAWERTQHCTHMVEVFLRQFAGFLNSQHQDMNITM